ncbi:MAG: hypothetical protein KGL43_28095, partial [Burkholderiales bacterium]|nr:hypothetical protein [Burkholderiales bacterium]
MRPARRRAFACCIAFSAALHLALLGAVVAAQRAQARKAHGARTVAAVTVRIARPALALPAAPALQVEPPRGEPWPAGAVALPKP